MEIRSYSPHSTTYLSNNRRARGSVLSVKNLVAALALLTIGVIVVIAVVTPTATSTQASAIRANIIDEERDFANQHVQPISDDDDDTSDDNDDYSASTPVVQVQQTPVYQPPAPQVPNKVIYDDTDDQDSDLDDEEIKITASEFQRLRYSVDSAREHTNFFRLTNPFEAIDAYTPVAKKYFNSYPGFWTYYERTMFGLKKNEQYCDMVDTFNLAHPENVFGTMNFVTDYGKDSNPEHETLPRLLVMREIGNDVNPSVSRYMGRKKSMTPTHDLNLTATAFFTKNVDFHMYHEIGRHFLCVSQIYNHIPGHGVLKRKDLIVDSFKDYEARYLDKPQCFNEYTFFPKSYRLYKEEECREYFAEVTSAAYAKEKETEPIQYLAKLGYGAHRAKGVFILDEKNEGKLRAAYEDGEKCGRKHRSLITQKYVANPLVLDKNNKFDFRIYMLVASTNPLIAYYHDGFLRVSLHAYDKNSHDRSVHLTNTHLSKTIFEKAGENGKWEGMTEGELRDYQMWSLERLRDYLLESGKIDDPNWLENKLKPDFKKAFVHLLRMSEESFLKHSGVFEMYGLDFMLDDQLNLWFIECNSSPQLIGTNQHKTDVLTKMLKDMFEIQYGLLRSRMKRVHIFMKDYHEQAASGKIDPVKLAKNFKLINQNKFEEEYMPSETNSWEKIIDKTLEGPERFMGLLDAECIDDY